MASFVGKYTDELIATARRLATPGRGILAADESIATMADKLRSIDLDNTEANRRSYRELLFTASGAHRYLSGAVLHPEALHQKTSAGKPFVKLLEEAQVIPGVKVDAGTSEMPTAGDETTTQGLDGLAERCRAYYDAGARFAKWRAVLRAEPSALAVHHNAQELARCAIACQRAGLVPVLQAEVLMDGAHDIGKCASATETVLSAVFKSLSDHRVLLEAAILSPNMVTAGADAPRCCADAVAGYTLQSLQRTVPVAVPGVAFVSGGQSEEEATVNLNAVNRMDAVRPWSVAFCYGRALQHSALRAWRGLDSNARAAKRAFVIACKANSEASLGKYVVAGTPGDSSDDEDGAFIGGRRPRSSADSLFVKNYAC